MGVHFVIVGSGRVGARLATTLDEQGHSVAIIDRDPVAFHALPESFSGQMVTGIGFDKDSLIQAGIEEAYAFAAVTNGDNSNIVATRIVREVFGLSNVVARIYDPARADLYQRIGIPTVGTVRWTTKEIMRHMMPPEAEIEHTDNLGELVLVRCFPHLGWVGHTIGRLQEDAKVRVGYLVRNSLPILPTSTTVIQNHDELHYFVSVSDQLKANRIASVAEGIRNTDASKLQKILKVY